MTFIGIDIGTGSVRSYIRSQNREPTTRVLPIASNYLDSNPRVITQSSAEILQQLIETIPSEVAHEKRNGIAIGATCSMVVKEVKNINNTNYLCPFPVDFDFESTFNENSRQDIILWMDNRASKQADDLNKSLPTEILATVGGRVIPEMGIAKLKWLSDWVSFHKIEKKLVVFEMYDWFSYALSNQTSQGVLLNENLFRIESNYAMDGSIKGWSSSFLRNELKVADNIEVGGTASNGINLNFPPIGQLIGKVSASFKPIENFEIGHGCIDCYSGWISSLTDPNSLISNDGNNNAELSMIAGTSTCFLLASEKRNTIQGIWGPFNQLLYQESFKSLYEFGQPATGKLFEELSQKYTNLTKKHDFFEYVELEIQKQEESKGRSFIQLLKDHFYYGDKYGNRSPFNEFDMREITMNGDSALKKDPLTELVIQYYLTIEFLVLQMKQIIDIIEDKGGIKIECIKISGSQSKNKRMTKMIKLVNPEKEIITIGSEKDNIPTGVFGARGASIIAELATEIETQEPGSVDYKELFTTTISNNNSLLKNKNRVVKLEHKNPLDEKVLDIKYWFLQKLSQLQLDYRQRLKLEDI